MINKGVAAIRGDLPRILKDADNDLSVLSRELFADLLEESRGIDQRFKTCEQRIKAVNQESLANGVGPYWP